MILEDLYFRNSENRELPGEYWHIRDLMVPYEEQIKQAMGFPFWDSYTKLYGQLSSVAEEHCFRSGVQFTLRFLLEGFL